MSLEHLFAPIRIGQLPLRNRIVVTAHFTGFTSSAAPGPRDVAHFEARAAGGAALLVTEGMAIHPTGVSSSASWVASEAAIVRPLGKLVDAVHQHGASLVGQLRHQGRAMSGHYSRLPIWAPSPLRGSFYREIPHAMDAEDLHHVRVGFAAAARHVAAAGADGVELNAAHGFLLHGFLSEFSNRRTDEYGGSPNNRLRLLSEVCQEVRAALPPDRIVGVRLSLNDFTPAGLTPERVAYVAAELASRKLIDYVSLSPSNHETWSMGAMVPDLYAGPAPNAASAGVVRAACRVPVVVAGGIRDALVAEDVLARGYADLVGMTRALLADPEFPNRVRADPAAARPCIGCNVCWASLARGSAVRCAVNPTLGQESMPVRMAPISECLRVSVIGGGVAGLEAARTAARAGHRVMLYERSAQLGGQLALAARASGRSELKKIIDWLEREVRAAGVQVMLGSEATVDSISQSRPDVVIVATGARAVPVADFTSDEPVGAGYQFLESAANAPASVVIVAEDQGWEPVSLAEHLARLGRRVELVTGQLSVGQDIPAISVPAAILRLKQAGVRLHTSARVVRFAERELTLEDVHTLERSTLFSIDELVLSGQRQAEDTLFAQLKRVAGTNWRVVGVGDCLAPRDIASAIWDGHTAALALVKTEGLPRVAGP